MPDVSFRFFPHCSLLHYYTQHAQVTATHSTGTVCAECACRLCGALSCNPLANLSKVVCLSALTSLWRASQKAQAHEAHGKGANIRYARVRENVCNELIDSELQTIRKLFVGICLLGRQRASARGYARRRTHRHIGCILV